MLLPDRAWLCPALLTRCLVSSPVGVCENGNMASPRVYVLQPWVTNLLVNYEQLDSSENLLAGQVLRVGTERDRPKVLQHPDCWTWSGAVGG